MLKLMRDSFQHLKWILVFIVFIFVLFIFVDWGAGGAQSGGDTVEAYAARVNGETISIDDYKRALYLTERRYEQLYGQPVTAQMRQALGLERQVLNSLIDERLMLRQADALNLDATSEEVRKQILEIPELNPQGRFVGAELYERYVTTRLSYASAAAFEERLARDVTLGKIENAMANTVVIPLQVAQQEYRRRNESATIRYVLVPPDRASAISIAPADVDAYYRANSGQYSHPEQRKIKYLLADFARIRSQITPADKEVRDFYDKTRESYKTGETVRAQHILIKVEPGATPVQDAAAKARAEGLVAALRSGADFAKLAKENSGDAGSAVQGGDLGFFERGKMVPPFEAAAFSQPIGQVGDPVKTDFGYHIIKVTEKRPSGYQAFEEVRPRLMSQLIAQRSKDMARERINSVNARIQAAKPKTDADLRKFADQVISLNEAEWFGRNDPVSGIGKEEALNSWAFDAKVNETGSVIETSRGPIIPFLLGTRPGGIAPLTEVRARAEIEVKQARAREAVKQILADAMKGSTLDAAAAKLGVTASETGVTEGSVQGMSGSGVQQVVSSAVSAPLNSVQGPFVVNEGAVAFEVTEQKKFDPKEFESAKASFMDQLRQQEALKLRNALLSDLRKASKILINEKLFTPAAPVPRPRV